MYGVAFRDSMRKKKFFHVIPVQPLSEVALPIFALFVKFRLDHGEASTSFDGFVQMEREMSVCSLI
jgi:hypothetical protein